MACCPIAALTNAGLSSNVFSRNHMKTISQDVHMNLIHDMFGDYNFNFV